MSMYMYSRSTGEWEQMPDVPYKPWSAMCSVVKNQGRLEFVVAGGSTGTDILDDVAIFQVEEKIWRTAKNKLPLPLSHGIALAYEDTFLV